MNTSLKYGIAGAILVFGTYLFLGKIVSENYLVMYVIFGLGILAGILAFIKGMGEIRRKENKPQAISGLILGLITGILPVLVWLVGMVMIIVGGTH